MLVKPKLRWIAWGRVTWINCLPYLWCLSTRLLIKNRNLISKMSEHKLKFFVSFYIKWQLCVISTQCKRRHVCPCGFYQFCCQCYDIQTKAGLGLSCTLSYTVHRFCKNSCKIKKPKYVTGISVGEPTLLEYTHDNLAVVTTHGASEDSRLHNRKRKQHTQLNYDTGGACISWYTYLYPRLMSIKIVSSQAHLCVPVAYSEHETTTFPQAKVCRVVQSVNLELSNPKQL